MRLPISRSSRPGSPRRGFTLIELLVVITIIGILAAIALPNYIRAKDKAKEVQVRSAVHSIQIVLERYQTDFEQYPYFLLGGDIEGWKHWHAQFDEPNPDLDGVANAWVKDPLVEHGYMHSYPANPFVDNGNAVIAQTGPLTPGPNGFEPGDGDPRFGFRGTVMGNGIEPVNMFANWTRNPDLNIETYRTLWTTTNGDVAAKGFGQPPSPGGVYPAGASSPAGMHYTMGGRRAPVAAQLQGTSTIATHWPGNFFYRAAGDRNIDRKGWTYQNPMAFVRNQTNIYILGGYGALNTEGLDVVRLEERDPSGVPLRYWFPPPWPCCGAPGYLGISLGYGATDSGGGQTNDWGAGWITGLPELFGGGDAYQGPYFPPNRSEIAPGQWIFGSPDGYNDGIVIALTSGDDVRTW